MAVPSQHIRRRWQLSAAWLHSAALYLPEPFLDIFALQKRRAVRSLALYTLFPIFGPIILRSSPSFPGMILSRAWRLRCTKAPRTSFSQEGEETQRDLGPATVQLLQYTANSQFLLNLFKSEEFQLVITSLVEGSVAAQLWKDRAQQLALGEQSGAPWLCCQFCFKPSLMCLPSAMQT